MKILKHSLQAFPNLILNSPHFEEVGWPHGLKLKTLIKSLLEKIF
jgi:hypothetical protein